MNIISEDQIREIVYRNPLALLVIRDKNAIKDINNYLPYSVGIEIECETKTNDFIAFNGIPNLISNNTNPGIYGEVRVRIPSGIKGLMCLYNISVALKENCKLNYGSGCHFHIDMTDCFNLISDEIAKQNEKWILDELDSWDYKGNYNPRVVRKDSYAWVNFSSEHKTAEFRIGEMTFDYEILVTRIIHASEIVRKLKTILGVKEVEREIEFLDSRKILDFINSKLGIKFTKEQRERDVREKEVKKEEIKENLMEMIKSRTIKI